MPSSEPTEADRAGSRLAELSDRERAALRAVVAAELAWAPRAALIAREHDEAVLAGLIERGWLAAWETAPIVDVRVRKAEKRPRRKKGSRIRRKVLETGPALTLTPMAAYVLRVAGVATMVEEGRILDERPPKVEGDPPEFIRNPDGELPHWGPPRAPRQPKSRSAGIKYPESIEDPAPGPPELAEEYVMDAETGEPVTVQGRRIAIDRRLARGPAPARRRKRKAG